MEIHDGLYDGYKNKILRFLRFSEVEEVFHM